MVALGDRIAGLMGNHQGWIDQVQAAADAAGEPVWPLPLPDATSAASSTATSPTSRTSPTPATAAPWPPGVFLQEFVGDGIPWAHLDIAGPADSSEVDGELVKGGTGFGVRTLVELLSGFTKPTRSAG